MWLHWGTISSTKLFLPVMNSSSELHVCKHFSKATWETKLTVAQLQQVHASKYLSKCQIYYGAFLGPLLWTHICGPIVK